MDKKDSKKQFHIKCPECAQEYTQNSTKLPKHINKAKILEY
jgi:hypothetical protein